MLYKKLQLLGDLRHILSNQAKTVAYIAGKVTGLPVSDVQAKFALSQGKLEAQGYTVLNPTAMMSINEEWQFAMRLSFALLSMADVVVMQSDWQDSTGAKMEFELAKALGIPVAFE